MRLFSIFLLAAVLQPLCLQAVEQPNGTVIYEPSGETDTKEITNDCGGTHARTTVDDKTESS